MIKQAIIILLSVTMLGCSMAIIPNSDGSCTLKGFGGGNGSIEGKCSVEKGLITFPDFKIQN